MPSWLIYFFKRKKRWNNALSLGLHDHDVEPVMQSRESGKACVGEDLEDSIPEEIWLAILEHLPVQHLCSCQQVSRKWQRLSQEATHCVLAISDYSNKVSLLVLLQRF